MACGLFLTPALTRLKPAGNAPASADACERVESLLHLLLSMYFRFCITRKAVLQRLSSIDEHLTSSVLCEKIVAKQSANSGPPPWKTAACHQLLLLCCGLVTSL